MDDTRIASALETLHRFVALWPNDPLADGARQSIEQLEPAVDELLLDLGLTGEGRLAILAMHEEVTACLDTGDCAEAIRIGEKLLAQRADFVPAMNNLGEAYFHTGQLDNAIAMSRRAVREQPENVQALANLTRYLFLAGRQDEARVLAVQLRSAPSVRDDSWYKKCEALSILGDDCGCTSPNSELSPWPLFD